MYRPRFGRHGTTSTGGRGHLPRPPTNIAECPCARCGKRGDAGSGRQGIALSVVRATEALSLTIRLPLLHRERAVAAGRVTFCISVLRALTARGLLTVMHALCTGHCPFGADISFVRFRTNALDPRFARKVGGVQTIVSMRCGCLQRLSDIHTSSGRLTMARNGQLAAINSFAWALPPVAGSPLFAVVTDINGKLLESAARVQQDWAEFVHRRVKEDIAASQRLMNCQSLAEMQQIYSQYFQTAFEIGRAHV